MIIHQALHGYNQGHNRLASSFPLSAQDDDKMKMLSDWSEYSGNNDNSYITTYPLSDGKHYVIAKRWYADDMERPGCVWTHSLIVDLDNLDEKFDFRSLVGLFKRPVKGEYSFYSEDIKYAPLLSANHVIVDFQEDILIWLYSNLINRRGTMLYKVEQVSTYYQELILLLLQYLPLGVIKDIAMCSGSAYGRRSDLVKYELQFAISTEVSLSTIVRESKTDIGRVCDGIRSICKAMTKNESDTSMVLRLFSSDIGGDTFKLCTVGLLLKYLDEAIARSRNIPPFLEILRLLTESFPTITEGKTVKMTFCKKSISNLFSSELTILTDLATNVPDGILDFECSEYSQRVVNFKAEVGIGEFANYLAALVNADRLNSTGENQLKNSIEYLRVGDYNYLAQNHWPIYMSLVMANPEILKYSFWIDLPEINFIAVYDIFRKYLYEDFDAWDRLFLIVLYRSHQIDRELMDCFIRYVPSIIPDVMDYLNHSISYQLNTLIQQYCASEESKVLTWLKCQNELTMASSRFLVENITPNDKVVQDAGSNIWNVLCQCDRFESLSYYTFMYILGHNWTDINGLKFIKRSFYQLHKALASEQLSERLWNLIEPYTAKLRFFNEWDKCKKLRKGVIYHLKVSRFKKNDLFNFTPDTDLNDVLLNIWDKTN